MELKKYSFIKQIGAKGFYAEITCKIEFDKSNKAIEIDENCQEWYAGIQFGLQYYKDNSNYNSINLNIIEIKSNVVDTSQIIVAFCVIKLLEEALGKLNKRIEFNEEKCFFEFDR